MDIQIYLKPQQQKIYSQVLTIACDVEGGLAKKHKRQEHEKARKRKFQQKDRRYPELKRADLVRPGKVLITELIFPPCPQQMICGHCLKPGHYKRDCRMTNWLCLACGSIDHLIKDCLFRRMKNGTLIRLALRTPLVQRGLGVKTNSQRKQGITLTTDNIIISEKEEPVSNIQYMEQEP